MKIFHQFSDLNEVEKAMITIGNFDGVHRGHEAILSNLIKNSRQLETKNLVISFSPNPKLKQEKDFLGLIYSFRTKQHIFHYLGIDYLFYLDFELIKEKEYDDFLDLLQNYFQLKGITASCKLKFGFLRKGDPQKIQNYFEQKMNTGELNSARFKIDFIQSRNIGSEMTQPALLLSSSIIRQWLRKGLLDQTNRYLYLPFHLFGLVKKGNQLGRQIGFPTINFIYPEEIVRIPLGSYLSLTLVEEEVYPSISFIGKPYGKQGSEKKWVETYLFNFSQTVYNKEAGIFLLSFLNTSVKTQERSEVKKIIEIQKEKAIKYFSENNLGELKRKIKQIFT